MDIDKEIYKAVVKEAIKEWMDERAEEFGKLTLKWIAGSILGFCIYLISTGFIK